MPTSLDDEIEVLGQRLVEIIAPLESCVVAYSGGVDSAVVAKAAALALGSRALAVTGVSASLADGELDAAVALAGLLGIQHEAAATHEFEQDAYLRNAPDRCFHCKTELYATLRRLADRRGIAVILNGANADDLADFRPGQQAGRDFGVRSPLAELGLAKSEVRRLARHWDIAAWEKPATPCLASRLAYGVEVTPERLARIDAAEQALRSLGLATVRVRLHDNELARIEAPLDALQLLCREDVRQALSARLKELGFRYITLDLEGFRSGSFQQLVPSEALLRFGGTASDRVQ
ncbi:MAG TPA: ATP-dependent sacrificial sulfur transferase LarE [Lacipirellulaceae bacterium]|nr:ATP-dependent sacrificial sulfur transferase LarE [Lacipirellulaceae bacterium]